MEFQNIILPFLFGLAVGGIFIGILLFLTRISKKEFDIFYQNYLKNTIDLENSILKNKELENLLLETKNTLTSNEIKKNELQNTLASTQANHNSAVEKIQDIENSFRKLEEENKLHRKEIINLSKQNSELSAINENLKKLIETHKEEITSLQEIAKNEFKNLANEILEEKTKKFTDTNKENLDSLLKPLGENIESFKKRINEVYENENRERFSLNNTIKHLMDQSNRISQEANNLATALKGQTKTQGDWGEMILERILEDSGLTKNREYFTQTNFKNEEGDNQRPDFILKLPGNQIVVIDSKVSLNSYERMVNSDDEEIRKQNLNLHIAAIKKHIDTLALKRYDDLKESLDFTIMFIPIEPAFLSAVQNDNQLWNYAYKKHVILLSPTNLIAYLKLISDVWKRTDQNKNAEEIARQAGALYDKFTGFIEDLLKIGRKLDDTKEDYESAMKKLSTGRGNLVGSIQKIKKLGASSKKEIPNSLLERADQHDETNTLEEDYNNE